MVETILSRRDGETNDEYKVRLLLAKEDGLIDAPWKDISEIFGYQEDYVRRMAKGVKLYRDARRNGNIDATLEKREILKEKVLARDERTAYYRDIRETARWEQKVDEIERLVKEYGERKYEPWPSACRASDTSLIIMLSDFHMGACFNSFCGEYSPETARIRLQEYAMQIEEIALRHSARDAHVVILGDMISGNIHKSIAVTNREDVVTQLMSVAEMIAEFIFNLAKTFDRVTVNSVCGNHSRIDRKDDAVKSERLDRLIPWYLKASFAHLADIEVNNPIDETLDILTIRGKEFYCVHGDFDPYSDTGIQKLVMMTGRKPYGVLSAHKHFPAFMDISGVKAIQGGSLQGSGDDYSLERRYSGEASQSVVVISDAGLDCVYPVNLGGIRDGAA